MFFKLKSTSISSILIRRTGYSIKIINSCKGLSHLLVNVNYFVVHSTGLHLENPNKDDFIQSDLFYKTHDIEDLAMEQETYTSI
jgi:hypothetical protein